MNFVRLVLVVFFILVIPVKGQNVTSIVWDMARSLAVTNSFVQTLTVNGTVLPASAVTCKAITATTSECEATIPNLNGTGNNIVISVFDKATNTTAETRINNFSAATFPPNPASPKLKLVQNISFP